MSSCSSEVSSRAMQPLPHPNSPHIPTYTPRRQPRPPLHKNPLIPQYPEFLTIPHLLSSHSHFVNAALFEKYDLHARMTRDLSQSNALPLPPQYLMMHVIAVQLRIMVREILLLDELSFSFAEFHFLLYHLMAMKHGTSCWTEYYWLTHERLVRPNSLHYVDNMNEVVVEKRTSRSEGLEKVSSRDEMLEDETEVSMVETLSAPPLDETQCPPTLVEVVLFLRNEIASVLHETLHKRCQSLSAFLHWSKKLIDTHLQKLNDWCLCLNEQFIPPSKSNHTPNKVFKLGLVIWRDVVLSGLQAENSLYANQFHCYAQSLSNTVVRDLIRSQVHESIRDERNTSSSPTKLLASHIIRSLCTHLLFVGHETHVGAALYERLFENEYLQDLEIYFTTQSEALQAAEILLDTNAPNAYVDISHHLIHLSVLVQREVSRFDSSVSAEPCMLNPTSAKICQFVCQSFLTTTHLEYFFSALPHWTSHHSIQLLSHLFYLTQFDSAALNQLEQHFFALIKQHLYNTLGKRDNTTTTPDDATCAQVMSSLCDSHQHFTRIIEQAFYSHPILLRARDQAFSAVINISRPSSEYYAEVLAKYSLRIMKPESKYEEKGTVSDASAFQIQIQRLLLFLKLLDNADFFLTLYRIYFAKRLILKTFVPEREQLFIDQLQKQLSSSAQLFKLKRMYEDVYASEAFTEAFRNDLAVRGDGVEAEGVVAPLLSASILTFSAWPYLDSQPLYTPHSFIVSYHKELETFYSHQHVGRKLSWVHKLEKGTLRCNGFERAYEMIVNSFQASMLLQFNQFEEISLGDLYQMLSLSEDEFLANLNSLMHVKVLKVGQDAQSTPQLVSSVSQNSTLSLTVNTHFKSRHLKLPLYLQTSLRRLSSAEIEKAQQQVDMDRDYTIQSIIVRIMKAERRLATQQLIQRIIQDMQNRFFKADVGLIKKNISALAEKEYLRYVSQDFDEEGSGGLWQGYEYLA